MLCTACTRPHITTLYQASLTLQVEVGVTPKSVNYKVLQASLPENLSRANAPTYFAATSLEVFDIILKVLLALTYVSDTLAEYVS